MKRVISAVAVSMFAIGAVAAPAAAMPDEYGYGKTIKDRCDASFGQLRQASPHPVTPSKGAKSFAETVLDVHCPMPE
jgi:hypothetical protein